MTSDNGGLNFNEIKLTAEIVFRKKSGAIIDLSDPDFSGSNFFKAWHEGVVWRDIELELTGATWEDLTSYVRSVSLSSNPITLFELLENFCTPIQECVLSLNEQLNLVHRFLDNQSLPPEGIPVINLEGKEQVVWTTNGLSDGTVVEGTLPANKLYPYVYPVDSTFIMDQMELFKEDISVKELFHKVVLCMLKVATKDNATLCFMLDQAAEAQGHRYAAEQLSPASVQYLRHEIEKWQLPAPQMLVTPRAVSELLGDPDHIRFMDLVTKMELFSRGIVGRWGGIELICVGSNYDSFVEYGSHSEAMLCTAPSSLGIRQVRVPLLVHPVILPPPTTQKTPPEKVGWYVYQKVTTSILQSRGVATCTRLKK